MEAGCLKVVLCLLLPSLPSADPDTPVFTAFVPDPTPVQYGQPAPKIPEECWGPWSEWTSCSKSCEGGYTYRYRKMVTHTYEQPKYVHPTLPPYNPYEQPKYIHPTHPPYNPHAGRYGRAVEYPPPPQYIKCPKEETVSESKKCNTQLCPVDCQFEEKKSGCYGVAPCGEGVRIIYNRVTVPAVGGGEECPNDEDYEKCEQGPCPGPVTCTWGEWKPWSSCSTNCGSLGYTTRSREVAIPATNDGDCPGEVRQREQCSELDSTFPNFLKECPSDCIPGTWSQWCTCTKTCNGGTRIRRRVEELEIPAVGTGTPCSDEPEDNTQKESCNTQACANFLIDKAVINITTDEIDYCRRPDQVCDPEVEKSLGIYTTTTREEINMLRINEINARLDSDSGQDWTAGETSLTAFSFSEVFAWKTGELPPHEKDRNNENNKRDIDNFLATLRKLQEQRLSRDQEREVYTTDAKDQGQCASCGAFAVTSAMETCVHRAINPPGFSVDAPRGLSVQNLIDCAFNSNGIVGCDGGQSYRYLQWLVGGNLPTNRDDPYVDGQRQYEVDYERNESFVGAYARRSTVQMAKCNIRIISPEDVLDEDGCLAYKEPTNESSQEVILDRNLNSWINHTETDIENILMDGHAVITTMEITEEFTHYRSGIFQSGQCETWSLESNEAKRKNQWNEGTMRPLQHAVVIMGFGVKIVKLNETTNRTLQYWKVKNSWGQLWGESGFFKIVKGGGGHCGIGAFISVGVCEKCPKSGCNVAKPLATTKAPDNLPTEMVFRAVTTDTRSPTVAVGKVTCKSKECKKKSCPPNRPFRVSCRKNKDCIRMAKGNKIQCCKGIRGLGRRIYPPRPGQFCQKR